jgi:ketosteroid isomerase-like protein
MMAKAAELTAGTFRLELEDVLANDRRAVALVDWVAEREGRSLRGKEIAVFRVQDGRLAEAWFYPDDLRTVDTFWA